DGEASCLRINREPGTAGTAITDADRARVPLWPPFTERIPRAFGIFITDREEPRPSGLSDVDHNGAHAASLGGPASRGRSAEKPPRARAEFARSGGGIPAEA